MNKVLLWLYTHICITQIQKSNILSLKHREVGLCFICFSCMFHMLHLYVSYAMLMIMHEWKMYMLMLCNPSANVWAQHLGCYRLSRSALMVAGECHVWCPGWQDPSMTSDHPSSFPWCLIGCLSCFWIHSSLGAWSRWHGVYLVFYSTIGTWRKSTSSWKEWQQMVPPLSPLSLPYRCPLCHFLLLSKLDLYNTLGVFYQLSSGFELKHDKLSGDEDVKVQFMKMSPNLNLDNTPLLICWPLFKCMPE
jgi:hypothetical protein